MRSFASRFSWILGNNSWFFLELLSIFRVTSWDNEKKFKWLMLHYRQVQSYRYQVFYTITYTIKNLYKCLLVQKNNKFIVQENNKTIGWKNNLNSLRFEECLVSVTLDQRNCYAQLASTVKSFLFFSKIVSGANTYVWGTNIDYVLEFWIWNLFKIKTLGQFFI